MSIINSRIIGSNQKRGNAEQPKRGDPSFVMSRSELVPFAENPRKWLDGGEVKDETKQMQFGSVLDCLTTTPEKFLSRFAVAPSEYPVMDKKGVATGEMKPWNLNSTWCKDWKSHAEAMGKSVVTSELYDEAKLAYKTLHEHRPIASLIECSEKQVLIVAEWKDEDTGLIVPLAALLDLVPHVSSPTWGKTLADIKTARSGNPAKWARVCDDGGYDTQAAIYTDLFNAARPDERRQHFIHVVQENEPPFHVTNPVMELSAEFIGWGRIKYQAALKLYCQCLKSGVWPSYKSCLEIDGRQMIEPDKLWSYREGDWANSPQMERQTESEYQRQADVPH